MTLDLQNFTKMRNAYISTIDLLGVPATWTQTKAPNRTANMTIGFRTASKDDVEVVNTYGFGSKIVTFKAGDFTADEPVKFDRVQINPPGGETYALDAVLAVHLNGTVIGYKGFIRGK